MTILFFFLVYPTVGYAHTSRLTLNQTNELYTKMAVNGQGVDDDGHYGMQCVDIPYDLTHNYVGIPISGNAIDLLGNARSVGYQILPANAQPKAGDLFVMDTDILYGHPFGHTGYIYQVNSDGSLETVEQNYGEDSNLVAGTPAKLVHRTRDYIIGYIRIDYRK